MSTVHGRQPGDEKQQASSLHDVTRIGPNHYHCYPDTMDHAVCIRDVDQWYPVTVAVDRIAEKCRDLGSKTNTVQFMGQRIRLRRADRCSEHHPKRNP